MGDRLIIRGARQHNLKNVNLELPRNRLIVFTGLSGSGKSSLAFDTIYAEGQRRYVESLSAYARQFLGQMDKPDVDLIEGLSPAISIDQKTTSHNPRSTVGTVTEIYDYLRLLYARIGSPHCHQCGRPIESQTVDQIVDQIMLLPGGTRIQILAPIIRGRKGEHKSIFEQVRKDGYVRVRVDGEIKDVSEDIELDKYKVHDIEVVVDRIIIKDGIESRLADSLDTALRAGNGVVLIDVIDQESLLFSEKLACIQCGISVEELSPRMFSFNGPYGACPVCDGLGTRMEIDPDLVLDKERSINEGGIIPWANRNCKWLDAIVESLCSEYGIERDLPLGQLEPKKLDVLLFGTRGREISFSYTNMRNQTRTHRVAFRGVVGHLEEYLRENGTDAIPEYVSPYMQQRPCNACKGRRLKPESLAVTVGGESIATVVEYSITQAVQFFKELSLTERQQQIARQILKEIQARLNFLVDVGLGYLTLSRSAGSLSGGEAQRIRLATQIGSGLVGVLYILDEPSIGLHQRDNQRLISTLKELRELGNTVIVVEHDEDTIRSADWIVDIGPGAGSRGGEIVAEGTLEDIMACPRSITGQFFSKAQSIEVPPARRKGSGKLLKIKGARQHNLKDIDVTIPLGVFVCVTGVSGSGKSTLINDILYQQLRRDLNRAACRGGEHDSIEGKEYLEKVINIDQTPIGRTPRSNPVTYTGVFDDIRELFAKTAEARMRGYQKGRFSFNLSGGRCESCRGDGIIKIEMHFLPDVYVPCEVCKGKRYNRETLEITYKGKNIADVLDMSVADALDFFSNIPQIQRKLATLNDVGLGYISLGQPATTLSGGEAQRVKLATELQRRSQGRTLYVLDEPTTGLHAADIKKLLLVLHRLVEGGNTVIVIEHNLDVIKTADYIIDLGPEGGDGGGRVVAQGTPEEVASHRESYTGQFLYPVLFSENCLVGQAKRG